MMFLMGVIKMKTNLFQQIEYTKEIDLFDLVNKRKESVKDESESL